LAAGRPTSSQSRKSLPNQRRLVRVICSPLVVSAALECHDIVPPLLDEASDDALDAVANKVSPHLVGFLLGSDQLLAVETIEVANARASHDGQRSQSEGVMEWRE